MRDNVLRVCGLAAMIVQTVGAPSALAAEQLSRKPGLWEVKTSIGTGNAPARTVRQCIDAATDQMLQSSAGPISAAACKQRNVQQTADQVIVDSSCTVAGKPATAHAVVTGSFDSTYTLAVTAQGAALPGGEMTMTMEGRWLGPCTADQKPGDVIMSNGVKINLPEIEKKAISPIDPMGAH